MMNRSQNYESISTVQLSPFIEDQWNRMITSSPFYECWTNPLMKTHKRSQKNTLGRQNLIDPIDIKAAKLEDRMFLDELHSIQRSATMSSLRRLQEKYSHRDSKLSNQEYDQQPSSPADEYERSSDFFHQTRESPMQKNSFDETEITNHDYAPTYSILKPQVYVHIVE